MSKTVYLFSRCSTAFQAQEGDSLRRQKDSTLAWLAHDFPKWKVSNKSFVLSGVSGYDGSSLGLGGFIDACKSGEVVAGKSVLAVEAPDRLSRLDPDETRELWRTIQKRHKVDIAITRWGIVFKHDESVGLGNDLMLTAAFHLARMESEQKSHRIKATFDKRRNDSRKEGGKKRTSVAPSWLKLSEDRTKFIPSPKSITILKRIFDMKLNRGMGPDAIARVLNDEGLPTLGGKQAKWSRTIIRKYLTSPACIGHFQPTHCKKVNGKRVYEDAGEVIKGYYPAVIDETTYWATQKTFKTAATGRKGRFTNLMRGLTFCDECGSTMNILIAKRKNGEAIYLKCINSIKGHGCTTKQIKYKPLEDTVVAVLSMLDYSRLIDGSATANMENVIEELRIKRDAIDAKIADELDTVSMANPSVKKRIMANVNKMDGELTVINENIATKQAEFFSMSTRSRYIDSEVTDYNSRFAFNNFISQYVEAITPRENNFHIKFIGRKDSAAVRYYEDDRDFVEWVYTASEDELNSWPEPL